MKLESFLKKNRRAELTTQQLVMIIILVISFGVLLIFLFALNLGETTDKEICHNSVLLQEKSLNVGSSSLDCTTSYVCISGGGECENFKEDYVVEISLNGNDDDKIKNISKAIADEMADCWWMFGEGQVDYVGTSAKSISIGDINCALCSVLAFDEDIQKEELNDLSYEDFYSSLSVLQKDSSETYSNFLYQTNTLDGIKSLINIGDGEFDFTKKYSITTGIGKWGALQKTGNFFLKTADSLYMFFFSWVDYYIVETENLAKDEDYGMMPVTIRESGDIGDLECDEFLTKA